MKFLTLVLVLVKDKYNISLKVLLILLQFLLFYRYNIGYIAIFNLIIIRQGVIGTRQKKKKHPNTAINTMSSQWNLIQQSS